MTCFHFWVEYIKRILILQTGASDPNDVTGDIACCQEQGFAPAASCTVQIRSTFCPDTAQCAGFGRRRTTAVTSTVSGMKSEVTIIYGYFIFKDLRSRLWVVYKKSPYLYLCSTCHTAAAIVAIHSYEYCISKKYMYCLVLL